jgi:hypothetical protein
MAEELRDLMTSRRETDGSILLCACWMSRLRWMGMELQPGIWRTKRKWLISRNSHGFLETPGRAGQARAFGYVVVCHSSGHLSYQSASWCKVTEYLYSERDRALYGQGGAAGREGGEGWEGERGMEGKAGQEGEGEAGEEWQGEGEGIGVI